KVRTGGITADKFPSTEKLARFLARAFAAHVPMKATAGLHHAMRRSHPMTYAADSQAAVMHGFANLVFAAALLAAGKIDEDLRGRAAGRRPARCLQVRGESRRVAQRDRHVR